MDTASIDRYCDTTFSASDLISLSQDESPMISKFLD